METLSARGGTIAAVPAATAARSYVDWPAIFAGTAIATAVSVLLLAFGSAIGFSLTSPFEGKSASKVVIMMALGLWILVVSVFSSSAGGYVTGRMRHRIGDSTPHEHEVRDRAHGLILWAVSVIVAGLLSAAGVSGLVKAGSALASGRNDPVAFAVDNLLRAPDARPTDDQALRDEIGRLIAQGSVRGELLGDDRAYLVRLVSMRAGIPRAEAEQRVDDVLARAKQTADAVRRGAIITAFLTAAALLAGAAAAAYGSLVGGRHRDQGTMVPGFRWR